MTSADAARLRAVYGIDKPLLERYLAWAGRALQGNFGYSRTFSQPVLTCCGRACSIRCCSVLAFVLATAMPCRSASGRRPPRSLPTI
jgi:peptide/nickel transport system permease protein